MKLSRVLVVVGAFLICVLHVHHGQARGPSTAEERAKIVALTRSLEQDPLAENAPATRQWLREWIIAVPDIRFKFCSELLGHGLAGNYPYSREVNLHPLFAGAAFTIEHPEKAREDIAVYHAGVEGALRLYEVLLKSKPDARSAFLDELVAMRDQGKLVDYIAAVATKKCKRAHTDVLAALGGAAVGLMLALFIAWLFGGRRVQRVTAADGASRHGSTRIAMIRRIVFVWAAYYLFVCISLHFLEPEYDPRFRFMSEYVWGAYGWLMTTTFFVLGLAIFAVATGIREIHWSSRSARIGFGLLSVGALFVCLAGAFKEFMPQLAASAVAIPSIVMATLLFSWSFRQAAQRWQPIYRVTLLITLGMLAAFLLSLAQLGWPGLQQRVFLLLLLLWLSIVVQWMVRITATAAA